MQAPLYCDLALSPFIPGRDPFALSRVYRYKAEKPARLSLVGAGDPLGLVSSILGGIKRSQN